MLVSITIVIIAETLETELILYVLPSPIPFLGTFEGGVTTYPDSSVVPSLGFNVITVPP